MQIPVRNLRVGDTLEWQANIVSTKAEVPNQFWGQENFITDTVTLSQTLELHVPKDIYVNVWSPSHKPTETVAGAEHIYQWTSSQLKPTVGKEADAEKERKKKEIWTPQQELDNKEGRLPDMAWTTFRNWEAVGAWYRSVELERTLPDATIKAKVAELTAGKASEEEKVRAVYSYVATQIRYIGVAFGIGRYQPHHASDVLENQYGDCKDKHTLLASMLTTLGLHPDAVLIGAGVRFNEAVPSPASFNHLITTLQLGGQQIWLDSTSEIAPYRALQYPIRDESALVIPETGAPVIQRTPANLPFASLNSMNAVGTLDKDGVSNAHLTLILRGDTELAIRGAFHQTSPAQYDQLIEQLSHGMGYAGTTSNLEISPLEDTTLPFKLSYDYKRVKAGDWDNYRIIPQVMPAALPVLDKDSDKDPPVRSITLGPPRVETSTSAMKIPDGWGAILPEAVHARSPWATFDETYRFEKGTVYADRKIEILQEEVPQAEWKSYRKWTDQADLGSEQYIQLTGTGSKAATSKSEDKTANSSASTSTSSDDKDPGSANTSNAEAARLIADAYQALQRHDLKLAESQLNEARNLNPNQNWLFTTYGYVDMQRFQIPTAVQDFEKELSLHPDMYAAYAPLAQAQTMLNQRQDAKETLQKWAAAESGSPQPTSMLVSMLLEDQDPKAAVAAAESAVAHLPEEHKKDEGLQLLLGRAQMKAGMTEKAHTTLLALMQSTEAPGIMNDCAYELADASLELPLDEAIAKKALDKMTDETKSWTLDEEPQTLRSKTHLLTATWDTYGWILYREGKLDQALAYIHAAWLNNETAEVGSHLAQIALARGNKAEALHDFELASATISSYDMMGVRKAPTALQKELLQHIEELRKPGTRPATGKPDLHEDLIQLRTIPLGPAKGASGAAEYRLLLQQGKVTKVEAAGDKFVVEGSERIRGAQLADLWPTGSDATLVRNGVLNCHAGICELVLEP
jgi:tetratricopeptide (TPR) repeat protein